MASQPGLQRTPSVHSLQLDEEEQLRIALALSAEEAGLAGSARGSDEDERLARQLQAEEDAEARRWQAQAQALPQPPHTRPGPPGPAPLPQLHVPPPPSPLGSALPGVTPLGGRGLVGGLRQASAEAMQRISSGSREVWQGLRRMAEPAPPPYAPPHYHSHAVHGAGPQGAYARPAPLSHGVPVGQGPLPAQVASPPPQQQQQLGSDEALAAALQRQFDLEERRGQVQGPGQGPPAWQQLPAVAGPLGANLPATTAAAAGAGGRPAAAAAPPPAPRPRPAQPAPSAAPQPRPQRAASARADLSRCGGCGGSLSGLLGARSPYIAALGRHWHPGCLVCAECARPIGERGGVPFCERQGRLYHLDCHKARFHPKCEVCDEYCPEEPNRRIVWSEVPFWRQRFCPEHAYDGTPRCASCERLRPHAQAGDWAELEDGRQLCLPCLGTIVTDTHDAQPLWHSVLRFFERMGMRLSPVPPMMLVDLTALNEAESQETGGHGRGVGPVFHVRGLTLTEEYASIRTVLRIPGGNPFAVRREAVPVGRTLCEVTGILVLYGLPRLLTGSILAHECMHAWLRMGGVTSHQRLAEQTEEGLCQLMAYLWLEAQQEETGFQDEHEERLAAYFAHQIRADPSPTYGDGFREAHEAFQALGLAPLLEHVQRLGALPPL